MDFTSFILGSVFGVILTSIIFIFLYRFLSTKLELQLNHSTSENVQNTLQPLKEKIELLSNCEETTACDLTSLDILRFLNDFNNYFEGEKNS